MNRRDINMERGGISVREAGRRGGQRTRSTHGRDFYQEIGRKGGAVVRRLIEEGKMAGRR